MRETLATKETSATPVQQSASVPASERRSSDSSGGARLQSLDCLRAIACLAVIYGHSRGYSLLPGGWTTGEFGVSLFCVLSGFLITTILLREQAEKRKIDLIGFLQRRALRIVPAYMFVLFATITLVAGGVLFAHHKADAHIFFSNLTGVLTFTANQERPHPLGHYWSVSIEEQFYCVLPIILLALRSNKIRILLISVMCLTMAFLFKSADYGNAAFFPLAVGTLLAIADNEFKQSGFTAWIAVALGVVICVPTLVFPAAAIGPYGVMTASLFAALVWFAAYRTKPIAALNPIAYIGRISYGIYLSHWTLLCFTDGALTKLGLGGCVMCQFALASLVSIGFASLSWRYFEEPILRYKNRLGRKGLGVLIACTSPALILVGVICHLASIHLLSIR
ncbi:MAG TPA: acyltransferase [Trichormus sp.]